MSYKHYIQSLPIPPVVPSQRSSISEDLQDIPVEDLIRMLNCRELKNKYVREQNYDAAAEIRDEEKEFYLKYPNSNNYLYYNPSEILIYIRNKQLEIIINE